MLSGPFDTRYRIAAIDPGTDTLGVSVLDVDLATRTITLLESTTYRGQQLAKAYPLMSQNHNDRFARLSGHRDNLIEFFNQHQPHSIASEAPYMGRFPSAYGALTECIFAIRQAVYHYDPYLYMWMIDPPTVKNAVGVGGKNGDKNAMKRAVSGLTDLLNPKGISFESLDEHSIDSIAVGYCRAKQLLSVL